MDMQSIVATGEQVRHCTLNDLIFERGRSELSNCVRAMNALYGELGSDAVCTSSDLSELIADNTSTLLFALDGTEIIGTAMLSMPLFATGREAWLSDIVVFSTHRRRGIAKSMITQLIGIARRRKCKNIELAAKVVNPPAHALYRACGFESQPNLIFSQTLQISHGS